MAEGVKKRTSQMNESYYWWLRRGGLRRYEKEGIHDRL